MTVTGTSARSILVAAALALLLAVRLLSPAGFMPAFDRGAVTIVMCPDAEPVVSAIGGHHHGHSKKLHQPCPYASASSLGATAELATFVAMLAVGLAMLLGRSFDLLERHRIRDRPPSRGPPLPA